MTKQEAIQVIIKMQSVIKATLAEHNIMSEAIKVLTPKEEEKSNA